MIEGFYIDCDTAECERCFDNNGGEEAWKERGGFEDWESPLPIFESSESDTPTHCHDCGDLIEHPLTDDGYNYVADAIVSDFGDGERSPVIEQWIDHYGSGLPDRVPMAETDLDMETVLNLHSMLPLREAVATS